MKSFNVYKKIFEILLNKSGKEKITIVVLIGILLLVISLPVSEDKNKNGSDSTAGISIEGQTDSIESQTGYETYLEEKLENILKKVEGVGEVHVIITLKNTSEKIVATDSVYSQNVINETDSAGGTRNTTDINSEDTNIYYDTASGSAPFVTKENLPAVEGVVVVAKGGGDGVICTNITEAVEALLGVPAHKVKIMKMS